MKRLCCLVTVLPLLISFSQVHAQEIGDTQNGLASAQQICSECHAIRRGIVSPVGELETDRLSASGALGLSGPYF